MHFDFLSGYWVTLYITEGHLVFAAGMTVYTLIEIKFKESLLYRYSNGAYAEYQKKVPVLIPFLKHE
jgi:protein-S-isoprenylcysteine O-methyltransferase Ste14